MTRAPNSSQDSSKAFAVENDTTAGYWHHRPENTLPPPDMMGAYMRNRPVPGNQVEGRKAWIIGSGIAGLAAAFYLIRDGRMAGKTLPSSIRSISRAARSTARAMPMKATSSAAAAR